MTPPKIETPRGSVILNQANMKAQLVWNPDFQPDWQKKYSAAQKFVDSEVLRLSEPFIPLRTGMLIMSGILGTEVGSGEVDWIAPYAKAQYYNARKPGSQTGPMRGGQWFERMKMQYKDQIITGARKLGSR
jgi:hypothetical protein